MRMVQSFAAALFAAGLGVPSTPGVAWSPQALPAPVTPVSAIRPSVIELLRCMAAQGVTLTSGHRGGVAPGYPENAIETVAHTLSQAPMLIEVDVRTSLDQVLVMMHDETLDRTTTGQGAVGDHSWEDLQSLYLVDGDKTVTSFRIPTLTAMLEAMRGRGVLALDVKEEASIPFIARAIADADAHGYAFVNVYRPSQAMILHDVDPRITIMLPVKTREDLEVLRRVGVNLNAMGAWVGIEGFDKRDPALWEELEQAGIPQTFATLFRADAQIRELGDASLFAELADQGVDVIATDLHLLAYQTLSARQDTSAALSRCDK